MSKQQSWWHPENKSGLHSTGRCLLVKPYKPAKKDSLIYIPDQVETQMQTVDQRAVVVEVGPAAFAEERDAGFGPRCEVGDHVMIAAYAGFMAKGTKDNVQYRYVNDRDVFATFEPEEGEDA